MREVYSVSQLATYLRELLETDLHLADLWVEGEVSNLSRSALLAARARPNIDPSAVMGLIGEARSDLDPNGSVYVGGELWTARADQRIPAGAAVRVVERDGLILTVEPVERS